MTKTKFKIGKTYITSSWTCGGLIRYRVADRDDKTVSLEEFSDVGFADGQKDFLLPEDYPIKEDDGVEYVVIGEYRGYEHRLYAEER